MTTKSLDTKLARILADPSCGDFILADAKDADMAGGMAAPGKSPEHHAGEGRFRSLQAYRELIRKNVTQGLVDIMLMSASTSEVLTLGERLFDDTHVTPAVRANDTTDIWLAAGGSYPAVPARPFRTATIDHAMCGKADCVAEERGRGVDLGLYSVTFNNCVTRDHETLQAYNEFRVEAERKGFCRLHDDRLSQHCRGGPHLPRHHSNLPLPWRTGRGADRTGPALFARAGRLCHGRSRIEYGTRLASVGSFHQVDGEGGRRDQWNFPRFGSPATDRIGLEAACHRAADISLVLGG